MSRRAAIYCRISNDSRDTGLGVDRQRQECHDLAEGRGWTVARTHVDNDISAYSGKHRPGYAALLADLEAGTVNTVLAWHPDRLHRSPLELEGFIALIERTGAEVHTVTAGNWDLTTATGRFFARQLGGVARYESEHRGERLRAKLEQNAARGVTHGRAGYGWTAVYAADKTRQDVIDEPAAAVVRRIAQQLIGGESLRSITAALNDEAVPSPRGGPWQKGMVRHLVLRPRNAGRRVHRGTVVGEGAWPAILDDDTYDQVVAVLADPTRRTSTGTAAAHLLSGIARCGVCGSTMRVAWNRTVLSYRCSGQSCVSRRKADVDDLVTRVLLGRLQQEDAVDSLVPDHSSERQAAAVEAQGLRARMDTAADDYADGKIDSRQLERITARLRPALDAATERSRAVDDAPLLRGLVGHDHVAEVWAELSLARQRAVVDLLMTITVDRTRPGTRDFDPGTVRIGWRT